MQGHSYETAQKIDEILPGSFDRVRRICEEVDDALQNLKTCPGVCKDGEVLISPPSAKPRMMPCPLVSAECAHGAGIARDLNKYMLGLMKNAGVPERHIDNFAGLKDTIAVSEARKWFYRRGFLVFGGMPGVGKSFGAAFGVYWYLRSKLGGWTDRSNWQNAGTAAENIQWASAKEIADDKTTAQRCRKVALLALDDLGKEEATKTGMAAVCDVICKRYDCKLPTVVTTELPYPDVADRYGRYIAERLVEDTTSAWFDCGDRSLRLAEPEVRA